MRHVRTGALPAALFLVLISGATGAIGREPVRCSESGRIAGSEKLKIDGAELYLLIRGQRCDAPVLLWLHGGPGGAERPLFRLYNRALEKSYVVAYWDQRGAGRSFDADADPALLTVERHLADLDRVVDHLRALTGREKIILVGHSWGSALGLLYARDHPGKVAAFVGVAQFVSGLESQRAQYAFALAQARRREDRKALRRLAEIGEPPLAADEVLPMQKLVNRFGGVFHRRPNFLTAMLSGTLRGYVAPWEIGKFIRANNVSLKAMHDEITALDLRRAAPGVEVPVVFMLGRHDRQLDSRLAADWFTQLAAPRKRLIWFERSAHNIPFEEPKRFNRTLVRTMSEMGVR